MRVGWSAAVINTMLGSTSGHTFGSGKIKIKKKNPLLAFSSEQLFIIVVIEDLFDFLTQSLFLPSLSFFLLSLLACLWIATLILSCPFSLIWLFCYFSLTVYTPFHPPLSLSLHRFLPSFYSLLHSKTSPCPFPSHRRHRRLSLTLCVCVCVTCVCPATAVPCPPSAVKHPVNYMAGQREGGWREGGKDEERGYRGEGDRRGLLTLLASHAETSRTNVLRGRVMNRAPKCSSSSLMKEGTEGGGKAFP